MKLAAEWLALRELDLPERESVELLVLRAAFMVIPTTVFRALGGVVPLPADPSGDGCVVATITIESDDAAVIFRLPNLLADWALECCQRTQQGARLFPARVRFDCQPRGIEVTVLGSSDASGFVANPAPEKLSVFLDESGNTGDATGPLDKEPFGGQAVFALAGVGEATDSEDLSRIVDRLRAKHGIKATEFKSRTMNRYPAFVRELISDLAASGMPLFVELMDKEYYVATTVVSHVLARGWLDFSSRDCRRLVNEMADYVVEAFSGQALAAYCEFAKKPSESGFATFRDSFRRELADARGAGRGCQGGALSVAVEEAFEVSVSLHEEQSNDDASDYLRLLPPPDWDLRGNRLAMLPHVQAFTNIYARINRFSPSSRGVRVVHDEQAHFGPLLREYATLLESNKHAALLGEAMPIEHVDWDFPPGKFTLEFADSRQSQGILAADVLARVCTRRFKGMLDDDSEKPFGDLAKMLGNLRDDTRSVGINIVSSEKRVANFYADGLKGSP